MKSRERQRLSLIASIVAIAITCADAHAADRSPALPSHDFAVSFHRVFGEPGDGLHPVSWGESESFVSGEPEYVDLDVHGAWAQADDTLDLRLEPKSVEGLIRFPVSHLAVYIEQRLEAVVFVDNVSAAGIVSISGVPSSVHPRLVTALSAIVVPASSTPTLHLVPRQKTVSAGGSIAIDVLVSGTNALRTFQVALDAFASDGAALPWRDVRMETKRRDFVFGELYAITAVDLHLGRAGGLLFDGSVDVTVPAYLTTFVYHVPDEYWGAVTFQVRPGTDSFLADPRNTLIPYAASPCRIEVAASERAADRRK